MSGSFINSGQCISKVVAVGDDNYAAKLNNSAKYYKEIILKFSELLKNY